MGRSGFRWSRTWYKPTVPGISPAEITSAVFPPAIELTELAGRLPRLKNFNVAVREWNDQIVFLRKIVEGGTDKSYGIQVARLAGVPKPVLERAKQILHNLEESELTPEGTVRQQARHRAEREKLQKLGPPPQLDMFGE